MVVKAPLPLFAGCITVVYTVSELSTGRSPAERLHLREDRTAKKLSEVTPPGPRSARARAAGWRRSSPCAGGTHRS
eukprot:1039387-Pleurochrysis_carterae.AAC.1